MTVPEGAYSREGKDEINLSPLSLDVDAVTALNTALGGVVVLREVISQMERAAVDIISATEDGKAAIADHVTSPDVSEKIEDVTIQAVTTNISLIANQVQTELAKRGYSSTV